jgi:nitrile hydratase accessory protein
LTNSATLIDRLGTDGLGAPPRSNGELMFAAPWESRVFGMAVALVDNGAFTLADFQQSLIGAIADWESLGQPSESFRYYECWLVALESVIAANLPVPVSDIDQRAAKFLARPAGHDHDHDHDHTGHAHQHGHDDHASVRHGHDHDLADPDQPVHMHGY